MAIKRGATVRQIVTPIVGEVVERRMRGEADEIECLVQWKDAEGNQQSTWFLESQIEEVPK